MRKWHAISIILFFFLSNDNATHERNQNNNKNKIVNWLHFIQTLQFAEHIHKVACITLNSCETNNIFAHLRFNFRDIMAMTKFELSKKTTTTTTAQTALNKRPKKSLKCSLLNVLRKTHVLLKTHALFVHMMLMLNRVNV